MALANRYVVLYFTNGPVPSADQLAEARHFGPHCLFRNTRFIRDGEGFEPCTAVAGDVPPHYARKFPAAVTFIEWLQGKLPVAEAEAPAGEVDLGADTRPLASRIIDPDKPSRPPRSKAARAAAAAGSEPQEGMTGTDSTIPPPPPPVAPPRAATTGEITLPPPPPPPED